MSNDPSRRRFVLNTGLLAGATIAGAATVQAQDRTDTEPRELNGQPMPEPPPETVGRSGTRPVEVRNLAGKLRWLPERRGESGGQSPWNSRLTEPMSSCSILQGR